MDTVLLNALKTISDNMKYASIEEDMTITGDIVIEEGDVDYSIIVE